MTTKEHSAHSDIEKILKDTKKDRFSSDTIESLARFHKGMIEIDFENHVLETPDGVVEITEDGIAFNLHESDEGYFYCADCGKITKFISEIVQIC